ncbi:hypothetical protein J4442_02020 [Candidatus Woesearchaeota archaeon]|nr:hypothetical protein [Candidatus Woesearchaeota archaeon]
MAKYKQLCAVCKKKHVVMENRRQRPICLDCEMRYWDKVENKKYKELFDIPKSFYEKNYFLRNVRGYYDRCDKLSVKQIAAFKKTVKEMKEEKKDKA